VRVGEILDELLVQVVGVLLAQRRLHRGVGRVLEALRHRGLLVADLLRDRGCLLVARAARHAHEELVGGELEVLVGERVRRELAGRVGLASGEQDEALAADGHHGVLELRGRGAVGVEALSHEALVALGLSQVGAERVGELRVAGEVRGGAHLGEGLLLDGVRVGQVLDELLVDRTDGHTGRPTRGRGR
jgi:hypothetical protein